LWKEGGQLEVQLRVEFVIEWGEDGDGWRWDFEQLHTPVVGEVDDKPKVA
jgi:hypothetical protein